ncbi:MAG TPA: TetR/AcrR family transcriptional regulator [Anaerolineae bacterium]|nr:TetR/AcrR family transcriptional regulator [Anaerolineae bacterium]
MNTKEPTRHERRRRRSRIRLQEAALALVLEEGYDAVTIQDITDRADLARGTFYTHFRDKEDIIGSVILEGVEAAYRYARERRADHPPPRLEYYYYLNIFKHAQGNRDLFRVMLGGQGSAFLTHRAQQFLTTQVMEDIQSPMLFSEFDLPPEILAQILTGAVSRLVIWWLETPNTYSPEQMAALLYEAMHHRKAPQP